MRPKVFLSLCVQRGSDGAELRAEFLDLRYKMIDERVKFQARAMLLWGDTSTSVSAYLTENGFSVHEAKTLIRDGMRERRRAVRKIALRRILIGLFILFGPAAGLWIIFDEPRGGTVRLAAILGAIALFGLWKVIDGLSVILFPKSIQGSISEVDE